MSELNLGFNLKFNELYELSGLTKVDQAFLGYLKTNDSDLADQLVADRLEKPDTKAESQFIIDAGPYLENFLAELFGIKTEITDLNDCHHALQPFFDFKRTFIQRKAFKAVTAEAAAQLDGEELAEKLCALISHTYHETKDEMVFVEKVSEWLADPEANEEALELATNYAGWALRTREGREKHA
ncbi:MAG TPA: pyridine nucleotide-disulfide oxidoreductase, partial [Rhodospirillales bacterium]|nr:pyridine nucleotide-disulfide oxidoreductase [Rhodospirillales bacterium]